jgi:hypothetical protein
VVPVAVPAPAPERPPGGHRTRMAHGKTPISA